jgi:carboxypeptidase C (cathepsin A)
MILLAATFVALYFANAVSAQLPAKVTDLTTITGAEGTFLRYKADQLCESTEGVKSYSGHIDIAEDKHLFFWFFESRNNPSSDPVTMWLNSGPGADSLSGLFDGMASCIDTQSIIS